jgi:hypothetical protein
LHFKSFNKISFLVKGLTYLFLFFLFFIGLHISANIIKNKDFICDAEKQSKFILECLNAKDLSDLDLREQLQSITVCGKIAKSLYCK